MGGSGGCPRRGADRVGNRERGPADALRRRPGRDRQLRNASESVPDSRSLIRSARAWAWRRLAAKPIQRVTRGLAGGRTGMGRQPRGRPDTKSRRISRTAPPRGDPPDSPRCGSYADRSCARRPRACCRCRAGPDRRAQAACARLRGYRRPRRPVPGRRIGGCVSSRSSCPSLVIRDPASSASRTSDPPSDPGLRGAPDLENTIVKCSSRLRPWTGPSVQISCPGVPNGRSRGIVSGFLPSGSQKPRKRARAIPGLQAAAGASPAARSRASLTTLT